MPSLTFEPPKLPLIGDAVLAIGVVAHGDAHEHLRRARRAVELGPHEQARDVDAVDALQVDLAQQAAVVPPAARGVAGAGQPRRREVRRQAAVVDAHHEVVDAAALERRAGQAQREREVGARVAADRPAVEPHLRAVVDRLEAHEPVHPGARVGQVEVLAVPADAADHRGGGVVAGVPRVRNARRLPAGPVGLALEALIEPDAGAVETEQPVAAEQVAVVRTVVVDGAARDAVGRDRRAGGRAREDDQQHRREQRGSGRCERASEAHRRPGEPRCAW